VARPVIHKQLLDRDWLSQQLQQHNPEQIAEILGCAPITVYKYKKIHGLTYKAVMKSHHKIIPVQLPDYMIRELEKEAKRLDESVEDLITKAIVENFLDKGINVFRDPEEKIDRRTVEHKRRRGRPRIYNVDPELPEALTTDRVSMGTPEEEEDVLNKRA